MKRIAYVPFLLLSLAACGNKGSLVHPTPPEAAAPAAPATTPAPSEGAAPAAPATTPASSDDTTPVPPPPVDGGG